MVGEKFLLRLLVADGGLGRSPEARVDLVRCDAAGRFAEVAGDRREVRRQLGGTREGGRSDGRLAEQRRAPPIGHQPAIRLRRAHYQVAPPKRRREEVGLTLPADSLSMGARLRTWGTSTYQATGEDTPDRISTGGHSSTRLDPARLVSSSPASDGPPRLPLHPARAWSARRKARPPGRRRQTRERRAWAGRWEREGRRRLTLWGAGFWALCASGNEAGDS